MKHLPVSLVALASICVSAEKSTVQSPTTRNLIKYGACGIPSVTGTEMTAIASASSQVSATVPVPPYANSSGWHLPVSSTYNTSTSTVSVSEPSGSCSTLCSKRGIPYNDVQYTTAFVDKNVQWAYNWQSSPGNLSNAFEYVPMLWGNASSMTSVWEANVKAAVANGTSHLLAFNEPDDSSQSNLSPADAATLYKSFLSEPFGGGAVKLGSPAVTNGGLSWLRNFTEHCDGCQIDFVCVHWYGTFADIEDFQQFLTDVYAFTMLPIWLTEFSVNGLESEISSFLAVVIPWLDSQSFVHRYAYFMAENGLLNNNDTSLSPIGTLYATD